MRFTIEAFSKMLQQTFHYIPIFVGHYIGICSEKSLFKRIQKTILTNS